MELTLKRAYHADGVNGKLYHGEQLVCSTIELPWRDNARQVSCIPEGRYELHRRKTETRGWHLEVLHVPLRSGILIHPANNARKELRGCIGPVTDLTGPGTGNFSNKATVELEILVFARLGMGERVYLLITLNAEP